MSRVIRVLLADDSELVRDVLTELLEQDENIRVVGQARDGAEAVQLNRSLEPDIVVLDLDMPVMNGVTAIERMLSSRPVPVLVVTGMPEGKPGLTALNALRSGALDVIVKPAGWSATEVGTLLHRVRTLSRVRVRLRGPLLNAVPPADFEPRIIKAVETGWKGPFVVAIGTSTGGPPALAEILGALPATLDASVLVVQHIGEGFDHTLARWLDAVCEMPVRVGQKGEHLEAGTVLLAPVGRHMTLTSSARLSLGEQPARNGHRPSVSELFDSVARHVGVASMGVLLTGMGRDGADGLGAMREAGAHTVVQDAASSTVYGMPRAAAELGAASRTLPLDQMASEIIRTVPRR